MWNAFARYFPGIGRLYLTVISLARSVRIVVPYLKGDIPGDSVIADLSDYSPAADLSCSLLASFAIQRLEPVVSAASVPHPKRPGAESPPRIRFCRQQLTL